MSETSSEQVKERLLGLGEAAFFSFDERAELDLELKLSEMEFTGIALGAPSSIDCRKRGGLPLVLVGKHSATRIWDVNSEVNTLVVAAGLDRGDVRVAAAFPSRKRTDPGAPGSRVGPPPSGMTAGFVGSKAHLLDAQKLCNLPWKAGRLALTVINFDWISNRVTVELTGDEPAAPPIPLSEEQARGMLRLPGEDSSEPLPIFVRTPRSPEPPARGVALAAAGPVSASAERVPVYGSFRVPLPECARVEAPAGETATPRAVMRGLLLLLLRDRPIRASVKVAVPIYAPAPLAAGDTVEGFFGIDLKQEARGAIDPGEYVLYFILGEHLAGPAALNVTA